MMRENERKKSGGANKPVPMKKARSRVTRREFLGRSAFAGAILAGSYIRTARAAPSKSANEKLNIACVGTQGRAGGDIDGLASENLVAFCDADENNLNSRLQHFPKATGYRDYRIMLEKEAKNIDAVMVGTPDHHHAPPSAMALRLGKHVYCEKPLTHTVEEARILASLATQNKLVTQMGTQIHAEDNYRRVVEAIQGGAIGPVREVHTWVNKTWSDGRFAPGPEAPAHLDWDLWLGAAPQRPFSPGIHPANWRKFWDYGTGTLGDMGCHIIDVVYWALGLRQPTLCWAEGPEVHPDGTPRWIGVHWQFPARAAQPATTLHWYDGGAEFGHYGKALTEARDDQGKPIHQWGIGALFIGDEGQLATHYGAHVLLPLDKYKDYKPPEQTIARSRGHHREFIDACKGDGETLCNFDYSGALTETVLLGTVAYRTGKKLEWDAKTLKATNAPEADALIRKSYRAGWDVVRQAVS